MSVVVQIPGVLLSRGSEPLEGRVTRVHRMLGHYVGERDPVMDVQVGDYVLTLCAPEAGKIMRCREVGALVRAGDVVLEITGVGEPTWELFIAHRWDDSLGHAGRIADRLIAYFGPGQVFRDIEGNQPGSDFKKLVRERLQSAFAMVVVVGPGWLSDRLEDPEDFHREEIRTALMRGIAIFPVTVKGAQMPGEKQLPDDIRAFANITAIDASDTRWPFDSDRIITAVELALASSPKRLSFLKQVPARDPSRWGQPGWQWIENDPRPEDL